MLDFLTKLPFKADLYFLLPILGCIYAALYVIPFLLTCLFAFYKYFIRAGKNLRKYGDWAIVTGATDGIGKAMAFELAAKGLNIILVSRTQSKLIETQKEILDKTENKIQVRTVAIDFSIFDTTEQFKLSQAIAGLNIGILINNVGQSYEYPEYFHDLDSKLVQSLIDLNIKSTTVVTYLVLPGMVAKKKGAIINISSFAGLIISPLLTEYSGCKAYVDKFSMGLATEYSSKGIHIQVQNPAFVATKLAKIKRATLFAPTPKTYARAAVRAIGYEEQISPYWAHALQIFFSTVIVPEKIFRAYALSLHAAFRKRALKRKEQNKTE